MAAAEAELETEEEQALGSQVPSAGFPPAGDLVVPHGVHHGGDNRPFKTCFALFYLKLSLRRKMWPRVCDLTKSVTYQGYMFNFFT